MSSSTLTTSTTRLGCPSMGSSSFSNLGRVNNVPSHLGPRESVPVAVEEEQDTDRESQDPVDETYGR